MLLLLLIVCLFKGMITPVTKALKALETSMLLDLLVSKATVRPCLKGIKLKVTEEETQHPLQASMGTRDTHGTLTYIETKYPYT